MPVILLAGGAWVAGLLTGLAAVPLLPVLAGAGLLAALALARTVAPGTAALGMIWCAGVVALAASQAPVDGAFGARVEATAGATAGATAEAMPDVAAAVPARAGPLARWRHATSRRLDQLFGAEAGLVRALLIAETDGLTPALRDRYAAAGLVHVLSISGLHVAIVGGALLLAFRAARLSARVAAAAAVAVSLLYVAAIGAPAPAVRSVALFAALAAARWRQRPVRPWGTFTLGALAPLALTPRTVADLGWQLSVAGYAAVVVGGRLAGRLAREDRVTRSALWREFVTGLLTTAATAPLVAWHFGRLSVVGPLANLVATPILAVLQPTLFLAMLLPPALGGAHAAAAARPMLRALDRVAAAAAAPAWASVAVTPTLAVATLAGLAAGALLVAGWARHPGRPALVAAVALAVMPWWPVAVPRLAGRAALELHLLDVGQGDAVALRTPRGRWIVVDAGRAWTGGDAGRRVVLPRLRRFGGAVALLVLTHPHADHIGGARSVVTALRPAQVRDGAFVVGSRAYRDVLDAITTARLGWARVRPGEVVTVDGVEVTFLAPDSVWVAGQRDPNAASAVVRVRYGSSRILLTGDAEAAEERWLLERYPAESLAAEVLKVAHHGSATGTTPEFLAAVHPRVALVSVGARNRYGHPAPEVMRRLLEGGATVLRTDLLGTVVLRTDGVRWEVEAAGHRWPVTRALPTSAAPGELSP